VLFAYAFRDAVRSSLLVRIAFGAIVGGAAGNIADRLQHQYVVDFIDFKTIWPNVFNVADSCITVGVIVLILASLRIERKRPPAGPGLVQPNDPI
jgi:signal peptidase II